MEGNDSDRPLTINHHLTLDVGKCFICEHPMTTHRIFKSTTHKGLHEVAIKIAHLRCERLAERRYKLLRRLIELNNRIFRDKLP
jgi:hypothetical protein